ncbi:DUF1549 domain-containing protein [Tundrisphaera lichenicola]|uniref:DUF1549 domain-containing protein n=1 Tax=Tundrisphaera lichenicola TaxID=2029860 RepID=UPI003EB96A19
MLSRMPFLILFGLTGLAVAEDGIVVLPAEFRLESSESSQRLLVQRSAAGEIAEQVASGLEWSTSDPRVATVADGIVKPVGDGEAAITVKAGGQSASAKVVVAGMDTPIVRSFREDVEPILAKMGCNSGACHGALAGKGGFRLSLNGFDPASDHFNIVKLEGGRRIELADPGRSLVLAKPTAAIPHKGGLRFPTDSREYRIIADWIASGAKPPSDADARVESLEVLPDRSVHRVGQAQPIVVRARYSDGRLEDVTRWVKWSSSDESVCRVDDKGVASVVGPGEGAVVAWYASKIAIARITVPYGEGETLAKGAEEVDQRKPRNYIDEQVDRQLARLNLPASPDCTDAEFVRRSWVDTVGRPPTVEEVRRFLADPALGKRDALIDELLARPEFADYWTYKWSDVLMLTSTRLNPQSIKAYYTWLHGNVAANTPWDRMVREILVSTGESQENGATNFYALSQSPEEMTENASQAFLGLSIGCARCHNHPLEKWTNDQYYAMANLFARVRAKGWGGDAGSGDGKRTLYVAQSGDLIQPRTGKPQPPTPLDGTPLPIDDPSDRRVSLADWLTAPENPYFARAITNRVWANFFGVGLVEKIDDVRVSNPASNEALLTAAADDLVAKKFDLKALMKEILQSNAYQRSSRPLPGNQAEHRFYSRYYPRRMMAEVLHDAIVQATEVPTRFENILVPGGSPQKTDFYPLGTRAVQLYDSSVENYFLQTFGRNPRRIVCECDRSAEPSIVQVLHISNGITFNEKLKAPGNRVEKLIRLRSSGMSDASMVDDFYLACLARYPTEPERRALIELLPPPGSPEERPVIEDVLWGLLSSREFLFNH